MTIQHPVTITIDRRLLEHPHARHLKRMRASFFLYLDLLARIPEGRDDIEVSVSVLATDMGLAEGTVRAWLGHLRRAGYIGLRRQNGTVLVTIAHPSSSGAPVSGPPAEGVPETSEFSAARIERALGERGYGEQLDAVLDRHPPRVIQRALAGALAPKDREIRRSRTALFLYLLKQYDQDTEHHPRP